MKRYTEYVGWRIRLWLAGYGRRVVDRTTQLAISRSYGEGRFDRLVSIVSPWEAGVGYRRVGFRRMAYRLRHPLDTLRFMSLDIVETIVYGLVERPPVGRFNSWDPQWSMKAEWLDQHSEYANAETGDTDWYQFVSLFLNLDVPWSLKPESWIVAVDQRGFVYADKYNDMFEAQARFDEIEHDYELTQLDEDPFENREGQPEFNGAFR